MSSPLIRGTGLFSFAFVGMALVAAQADVALPDRGGAVAVSSQALDATLASDVQAHLQRLMPDETIQVRTANAGLVLSGQIADPDNLPRALSLAEEHAPGRVSNLLTVGRLPQIELGLQLAEMPRAVARNLSASMGMADIYAPSAPGEAGALPGLIAALEAKGVLRSIARSTLMATAGQVTHLPAGSGCASTSGSGIGMDVTPTLAEDGAIAVTLRTCLPGRAPGVADSTVTILLQDGQTFAVADVLPDLLRAPGAYNAALADEPTLGPLLASADYREGRTEVMILITARIGEAGPILSQGTTSTLTGGGVTLIAEPVGPGGTQAPGTEAFTLSHPLLK